MSFVYDQKVVDSMYGSHVVSMAVDYGVDLVKMWPLQTNQELENDVKYAENLQVMFSGMMTQVLLKRSEEVDQSVAEAVYEGMDVLPGVDPEIIRTLMDANRAYDVMASYHGVDGINLKRIFGDDACSVFIMPPSVEELRRRLEGRGTDAPEVIDRRVAKAEFELTKAPEFDHVVVNDCLDEAVCGTCSILDQFIAR